jgi:hypothetical protein
MKTYSTIIYAIPIDSKETVMFHGPNVKAFTKKLAQEYCELNGLGYCIVGDEIVAEGTFQDGKIISQTDYNDEQLN